MKKLIIYMLASLLLTSCAHAFKEKLRKTAEQGVPFTSVQSNIDRDTGAIFIWGGTIANSVIRETDTFLEVVQTPLDKYGKVVDPEVSEGRFIVYAPSGLDPEEHSTGRMITAIGFLVKGADASIDGKTYTYPVMEALEIRSWKDKEGNIPKAYYPAGDGSIFPWNRPVL